MNLQPWRRVYELSKRTASENRSITIVTDKEPLNFPEKLGNIKLVYARSLIRFPFSLSNQLISVLLETQPDVIIWYGTPLSIFYFNRLKALKAPLVLDIDTDFYSLKALLRLPLREVRAQKLYHYFITAAFSKWITRAISKSGVIDRIIVPNTHISDGLTQKGIPQSKITIVPSTVENGDIEKNNDSFLNLRTKVGLRREDFVISFFGSPTVLRGADIAIKSMKKVIQANLNAKLLFFSRRKIEAVSEEDKYNQSEERRLEKLLKKYKVGGNVLIVPGYLESSILRQYLLCSDCIILPFRIVPSEPPLSVFETMKMGKALITTKVGGLPDIIGENRGILIEPGDVNALARAITSLMGSPETVINLGHNALEFSRKLLTWREIVEIFTQTIDSIYQNSCLGSHRHQLSEERR